MKFTKTVFVSLLNYARDPYIALQMLLLSRLRKDEIQQTENKIASDEAISYDCLTHQFKKSWNLEILSNFWQQETFQVNKDSVGQRQYLQIKFTQIFLTKPNLDLQQYKVCSTKFLDQDLMINFLKQQTGFVKGLGTQVNILVICVIFQQIKNNQKKIMVFIDFSNVYNTNDSTGKR
ncbi:unnamed protein product [Paramecium primaurelia]|uniref:Uncharacterized protein n=1 Tax=Paramecium primaurelia TaxID=5886 RepID=A0A8S1MQ23_PARPR|nr:unnamed protein product [Paramecium primaurelia]